MEDENEADLVLEWMDTGRGPRGERLAAAAQVQAAAAVPQIGDCKPGWQRGLQAMFAAEFPVAHEQHKAEAMLAACRQVTAMSQHIAKFNRLMAKSGRCGNSEAARSSLTSRLERKRFANSCVDTLPVKMRYKQGGVCTPRTYLLRQLYRQSNMQLLQEAARAYRENELLPRAVDAGIRKAAYWPTASTNVSTDIEDTSTDEDETTDTADSEDSSTDESEDSQRSSSKRSVRREEGRMLWRHV
jgi:hypothetical protein